MNLPDLLAKDTLHVLRQPGEWDAQTWTNLSLGTLGVIGAAIALDPPLDRAVRRNARPGWDRVATNLENLGGTGSLILAGGAYLGGQFTHNPTLKSVGTDAGMSMAIAQLAVIIPLKYVVGRARPSADKGTFHFKPFQSGQSFPSGHTAQAFILASVISAHADSPWVSGVSYGTASLVALSRVERRDHFLSDVLGGALIGTFVGRTVVRYNESLRSQAKSRLAISFEPLLGSGYQGAVLRVNF
ncbi:phosphatase PAP2 family protein [Geothrix sp. 21YS21S-4]|uniref:phosphatase PAP2 family protein n=1 Tax=Geothrix sp. 21YS21S-4 TaxID=3068889 RepID=UPI0027B8F4D5|nr:phosphatase PAP2 family protein [Geothrix sp. 21YS21S-4]